MKAGQVAVFIMSPDEDLRADLDRLPEVSVQGFSAEAPLSLHPPGGNDIQVWLLDERASGQRDPAVFQSLWDSSRVAVIHRGNRERAPNSSFPSFTWPEEKRALREWIIGEPSDEARPVSRPAPVQTGQVLAVAGPAGGVGKSFLATNLGAALASAGRGETLVVDLDFYLPRVNAALNLEPRGSITQLLPYLDSLTWEVWERNLSLHETSGLAVLSGPSSPEMAELVEARQLAKLIEFTRRYYQTVILDLPSGVGSEVIWESLAQADRVLVVCRPDAVSVKATKSFLDLCEKLQIDAAGFALVVNFHHPDAPVPEADLRSYLNLEIFSRLRTDPARAGLPQLSGQPLLPKERDNGLGRDLYHLASALWPQLFSRGNENHRRGVGDLVRLWKRLAR